ncbi:MAG: glycosyltransferase family 9 protein [Pyrinomonadaceae bacterium]
MKSDLDQGGAGRRILVHRIGHLGDTIITLPAFWAIRAHFPQAHIALLSNAFEGSNRVVAKSVLPATGLFDQWLTYLTGDDRTPTRGFFKLLLRLRRERFDTLVYLAPCQRTPRQVRRDLLFFRAAGIRRFIGHQGFAPYPPRVEGQPLPLLEREADHLLGRLERSGIPVPPPDERRIDLKLTHDEIAQARSWLESACGEAYRSRRLVGFCPGSKWLSKIWPEERFAEVGRSLVKEEGLFPVVFGGADDRERGERLIAYWRSGANAAGSLNVREGAAALGYCRLYVGNDTGTMHMAAAVGTPCVVTLSAQDWPGRWYPYGEGHIVLRRAVSSEGCMLSVCNRELQCLTEITAEDVLGACRSVLERAESRVLKTDLLVSEVNAN